MYSPNITGSFQRFPGRFVMTQSNRYLTAALRYFFAIVLVVAAFFSQSLCRNRLEILRGFSSPQQSWRPLALRNRTGLVCRLHQHICGAVLLASLRFGRILQPRDIPYFVTFVVCELVANRVIAWRIRTETALKEAHDQLERRVAERTADLDQANHALRNQMAEQLRTEEALQAARTELARVVRITTVGELATSIAHEVNQPLAAVVANADACVSWLTLQDPNLSEAQAAALRAVEGATRASEVIARIRSLITKGTPEILEVDINNVIEETITLTRGRWSGMTFRYPLHWTRGSPTYLVTEFSYNRSSSI